METQPITQAEVIAIARANGYTAHPPKGGDIYFAVWDDKNCFLIATLAWIRQRATVDTFPDLLEVERSRPRFYR